MGISGLLPLLKPFSKKMHIQELKGKTVGVDAFCWLHRGCYSCSYDLCTGASTAKYVNYCMNLVRMMKFYQVTPYLVFDGGSLPAKKGTDAGRKKSRDANLKAGMAAVKMNDRAKAQDYFQKAVRITPQMSYNLMQELEAEGVEYVVAPYEADAQLAFLARTGRIHAAVSEDSDLLAFGIPQVIFKMDKFGHGTSITLSDLGQQIPGAPAFSSFSQQMITQMCILAGCDYLPSISGMGIKRAFKAIRQYKSPEKAVMYLKAENRLSVPEGYLEDFRKAELTFRHQRVYDVDKQEVIHLYPLNEELEDTDFLGPDLPAPLVVGLCTGKVDVYTHEPLGRDNRMPKPKRSFSLPEYSSDLASYLKEAPPQANNMTKYFAPRGGKSKARGRTSSEAGGEVDSPTTKRLRRAEEQKAAKPVPIDDIMSQYMCGASSGRSSARATTAAVTSTAESPSSAPPPPAARTASPPPGEEETRVSPETPRNNTRIAVPVRARTGNPFYKPGGAAKPTKRLGLRQRLWKDGRTASSPSSFMGRPLSEIVSADKPPSSTPSGAGASGTPSASRGGASPEIDAGPASSEVRSSHFGGGKIPRKRRQKSNASSGPGSVPGGMEAPVVPVPKLPVAAAASPVTPRLEIGSASASKFKNFRAYGNSSDDDEEPKITLASLMRKPKPAALTAKKKEQKDSGSGVDVHSLLAGTGFKQSFQYNL